MRLSDAMRPAMPGQSWFSYWGLGVVVVVIRSSGTYFMVELVPNDFAKRVTRPLAKKLVW